MNYQTLTPELLEQLTAIAPGRVFAGSDINEDYSHDEMPIYGKGHARGCGGGQLHGRDCSRHEVLQ